MDLDRSFGRLLKRLRKARDLTQEALAQRAYCAVDTIKKIEQGARRPSRQLAEQFADCLELAVDERAAFLAAARANAGGEPARRDAIQAPRHATLPQQPTPLVGRAAELSALAALFRDPGTRLVTITGPGGMGKTRLAIALADQLLAAGMFPDGVCFVPLAALDSAERVVPALAAALGLPPEAGQPQARSEWQQVLGYLEARQLLLVLDNVEHLLGEPGVEAGGAADLVAQLLDRATGLVVLATSRERLRLRAERVFALGGLDTPADAVPDDSSALALFVQRAQQLRPGLALTPAQLGAATRICRLVEGMPLAIELAAGWVDTLAPIDIAAAIERGLDLLATELHDAPARHRSMRAVFGASYQRLGPAEQAIFAQLASFRGGATLEAVQAITGATPPQLQLLVGASLLAYDPARARYALHELLRQYALEQLNGAGGEPARERHAVFYCAFAERQAAGLAGPEQNAALAALDAERDNLRAAWDWAAQRGRADLLMMACDGLGYFYEWRAAFGEGERAYGGAAGALEAQPIAGQDAPTLACLRAWQASFRRLQGDIAGAELLLRQALATLERAAPRDTQAERAFILLQLGLAASEGRLADARGYFEQSLALYQALGRRWEASQVLLWLGDLCRYQGANGEARQHFQASLAIRTECGDRRGMAEVLIWDAHSAAELGQVGEAELLARRSSALRDDLGDAASRVFGLGELGIILIWGGNYREAHEVLRQALALYQDLGNRTMAAYAQSWLAVACLGIGEYEVASALSQRATAHARDLPGATSGLAFVLHYAGWVALVLGEHRQAEALLAESVALHQQSGSAGYFGWPLAQLAYAHWLLGEHGRARAELLEVLSAGARQHAFTPVLLALPVAALLLAEHGYAERAVELYALAWRHPLLSSAQCFIDIFGRRLDAVAGALPPAVAAAAQARGRALSLWDAAARLDAELRALARPPA